MRSEDRTGDTIVSAQRFLLTGSGSPKPPTISADGWAMPSYNDTRLD